MKEKEMKRVPKLRFPEFTDDWEQCKLGDLGTIQTCKRIFKEQTSEIGEIPFYKNGTIGLKADAFISKEVFEKYKQLYPYPEKGDILISAVGSIGRTAEYTGKDEYFQDSNVVWLKTDNSINKKYLKVFYQVINWLIEGSTVKHLYNDNILKSEINFPKSFDEQGKIGQYFEHLDHLITLHQRKLEKLKELRKGVMKKLFNQEVRFKADDESEFPEWEKKKIGDVFSQIKDKNKDGRNQNVITNSAEFGLINQRDFFDKDIAVDGKTENYTVIKTGDFVYNPRKSKQAPYGPFNCYQLEENGIVSPLYTCLRPKSNVNDKYLLWYFKSGSWYRFIYENGAQNGARHDRVGMTDSLMQEIPVYLPQAVEEQQKIADCLLSLDDVIAKQKATLAAWEELKKGLLQQMFV